MNTERCWNIIFYLNILMTRDHRKVTDNRIKWCRLAQIIEEFPWSWMPSLTYYFRGSVANLTVITVYIRYFNSKNGLRTVRNYTVIHLIYWYGWTVARRGDRSAALPDSCQNMGEREGLYHTTVIGIHFISILLCLTWATGVIKVRIAVSI